MFSDRGDRDYRSSGGTGMNRDRRDNNQRGGGGGNRSSDYGGPRRDNYAGNDMRRDDREVRESKEVRETREPRRDMPKFVENTGTVSTFNWSDKFLLINLSLFTLETPSIKCFCWFR